MDALELFKESTKDILSDENLQKLDEAIKQQAEKISKEKYDVKLESALAKQDAVYAEKLQTFLEDIDEDHANKLQTIIEGINTKHLSQLKQLVNKYKTDYVTECKKFKESLVGRIDKYFDMVVEQAIPKKDLQLAIENTQSKVLLEKISQMLQIDKIKSNPLVKEGIAEAKNTIDNLTLEVKSLKKDKERLVIESENAEKKILLEEKCQGLPKVKRNYIQNMLSNKSIQFIKENFDYVVNLYDDEEKDTKRKLKTEALKKTKVISENIDAAKTDEQIDEAVNNDPMLNSYLTELSRK